MARKNILKYPVLTDQSLAASFQSAATLVKYLDNCSYQVNVTTTDSEGTLAVQSSNDYEIDEVTGAVVNAGTWIDLPLAGGTPVVNAADTNILIDLNQLSFIAIRLSYTSSVAGTGVCSATLVCRQIGG